MRQTSRDHVAFEQRGSVALVRMNRPEAHNALSEEMRTELLEVLEALDAAEEIRCIVLIGTGRSFAAGVDIKEVVGVGAIDMFKRQGDRWWHRVM